MQFNALAVRIQLHIHDSDYDSSHCDLYCSVKLLGSIGMDKTENSEISTVSHNVFTVSTNPL